MKNSILVILFAITLFILATTNIEYFLFSLLSIVLVSVFYALVKVDEE
ncbi:MAG: hypothetical protein WCJ19_04290 [bacterium]